MAALDINDDTFDTEVLGADVPVVVDFWAEWCVPCKKLSPNVERVAEEMAGKVKVAKLNVDENPVTMTKYGVRGLPTLILFKNGKVTATHLGDMNKDKLEEWIKSETA
ncbi:thioredoxin [Ponticaulis sp.]|mgnify:FL=1|uniref:thioredoxin n=1 Tax=Ponticaulis sp. TaxID=2020902 RepID=UPI000B6E2BB2|nr:thioredoxin [Ponticaulis sp.]MAI91642.1 thioredoxin [Ponticaulis sp.]OUX97208.1 MAG: thioredoxin [Hyphomonadaceae bacterium TMED5]|tara:strand:+ start:38320 stop:38643 length:324 start_codon:yes stop_codon:yes gene_type:complete